MTNKSLSDARRHPLWDKWEDEHKTRAMLLGVAYYSIGFNSYTYEMNGQSVCIETLQPVHSWATRYSEHFGVKKFYEWVAGQEITTGGNNEN